MSFVSSFQAAEEGGNRFTVNVNETIHRSLSGERAVRDFSLEETGEVLREEKQRPGNFIGSKSGIRLQRIAD